tara:strand:- start:542 stop:838 length:297 start_codon:yes stop_codon:yes gene_type:complete
MSHTYFSTSPFFSNTYHIVDLDKQAPHRGFSERDSREEMRKGGGDRAVVPVYKYETNAFPELRNLPRGSDSRHKVLEERRQKTFNKSLSNLIMERPLG